MKRLVMLIVGVGLIVGAAVLGRAFPSANSTPIDLDLLWLRIPNVEVWQLTLASIALGLVAGGVFVGFFWLRGWVVNRRYRKLIKRLESELHQLRSLPLAKDGQAAIAATSGGSSVSGSTPAAPDSASPPATRSPRSWLPGKRAKAPAEGQE